MSEQFIYIVDFPNLHNILSEVKNLFNFKIKNFTSFKIFLEADECTQVNDINSIIIVNKKKQKFLLSKKTIDKNILIIDELPLRIEKLIYKINIQLIKQHYNIQSKINVKGYTLDLNKRIIKSQSQELRLTEKEINVILFLLKSEKAQSINNLQESVYRPQPTV